MKYKQNNQHPQHEDQQPDSEDQEQLQEQPQEIDQQHEDEQQVQEQNYNNLVEVGDATDKGVVYMSRIPPFMTPSIIRKLLSDYGVQRIYLLPQTQWARKNRIKKGGSKRICFREGWIEFTEKRMGKMAAMSLNGQKMGSKKGNFYAEDLWNLKYLPKFKWHNLTERLAHEERLKKERLKLELDQEQKVEEFYSEKMQKSRMISGIVRNKETKGKSVLAKKFRRANQKSIIGEGEGQ